MQVYKGKILTCDACDTVAKYLVTDRKKIVFVGDELPAKYGGAPVTELGGRALIPAFTDSHIHFASFATFHSGLNVMEARSNAEILDMLRDFAARSKDKMLMGFGASPYSVEERRLVTRREIDSVCSDRPVFLGKYDGHACIVNTKLLEEIRGKASHLRGFHEDTGEMNQEAFFAVSDHVTNSIPIIKLIRHMQEAADFMASRGIGMIHTVSGVGFPMDMDVNLERWFARGMEKATGLQMRVFFQTMDVEKVKKRHLPRIGGCFETALDGCFGSEDAALLEPYEWKSEEALAADLEKKGVLYYSDEKVTEFCKRANREGLQIEVHAIGDAAFDQAARALKAALDDCPRTDHRHAIIHDCLPTAEGLNICREYGIFMPVQSAFIKWPQEPEEYLTKLLGKERAERLNPLRDFEEAGIVLSAGSDGPCTDPDPIDWIYQACNHSNPAQSLSVREALKMCTYNGYYTTFDEKERGSLEAGKIADMVILSESPYDVPVEELKRIRVEQLLLGGEPYKGLKKNPIAQILSGMMG